MSADDRLLDSYGQRMREMHGMPIRQTTIGERNALSIEFGTQDRTVVFRSTIGSVWRWQTDDRMIVASGDSRDDVSAAIAGLVGRRLSRIGAQSPSQTVRLEFDNSSSLFVFPVTTDWWEHWTIDYPDGWVLTSGPGSGWDWDSQQPGGNE